MRIHSLITGSDNTIYSYELPLLAYELQDTTPHGDALVGRVLLHTLPPEFKVSGKGLSKVFSFRVCFRICKIVLL